MRLAIVIHTKYQRCATGVVGGRHQVLGKARTVVRQAGFSVQLIDLMRHGRQAFSQALYCIGNAVFCSHVIASV